MSGLSSNEIKNLYKSGRKYKSNYFTVIFDSSADLKISPVVSKKISKKAVVRNKIKRRIRHLGRMFLKSGKFIIISNIDISQVDFEKLKNDFKKISIKCNKNI